MIPEEMEDLAVAYVLEELPPVVAASFEAALANDPGLAALVRDLRETLGAFARSAPPVEPPPALRERIVAIPFGKLPPPVPALPLPRKGRGLAFAAALLAVLLAWAALDDGLQRRHAAALRRALASAQGTVEEQKARVLALESRNALNEVKVAALQAQTAPLSHSQVVVVWDTARQEGFIKLGNMPKPDAGKDYQLWILDAHNPAPVSAGVLSLGADGTVVITFRPDKPVVSPDKFAISVERAGGVPQRAGPIVFVGG